MSDADESVAAGRVEAIWTAPEGSALMEQRERVRAVEGGLEGDRYLRGTGYYSPYDVCEVTLIAGEAIDTIASTFGIDLSDGRHRRNLVTRGVDLDTLLTHRFRIGEAVLEGTRPRPPCRHVEEVADEDEVARALGDDRGGICTTVVEPGAIAPGDEITLLESTAFDGAGLAAAIRDRQDGGQT